MTDRRFPLHWPAGRLRTPAARRRAALFRDDKKRMSISAAFDRLQDQLDRLGATGIILSTNLELRVDGVPRADRAPPADTGVALFFQLHGKDTVLACDRWDRVADNIAAIAAHIDALRGMDRWGVGSIEQAFAGYQTLPAPEQWWQVLGVGSQATRAEVEIAYRRLAPSAHPDTGGSTGAMARLNAARDDGLRNPTAKNT